MAEPKDLNSDVTPTYKLSDAQRNELNSLVYDVVNHIEYAGDVARELLTKRKNAEPLSPDDIKTLERCQTNNDALITRLKASLPFAEKADRLQELEMNTRIFARLTPRVEHTYTNRK